MGLAFLVIWMLWMLVVGMLVFIFKRPLRTIAISIAVTLGIHFGAIGVLKLLVISTCNEYSTGAVREIPNKILVLNGNLPNELIIDSKEKLSQTRWDIEGLESTFDVVVRKLRDEILNSDRAKLHECGEYTAKQSKLVMCNGGEVVNVSMTSIYEPGSWAKTHHWRIVAWMERFGQPEKLAEWRQISIFRKDVWTFILPITPRLAAQCSTNDQSKEEWIMDLTRN